MATPSTTRRLGVAAALLLGAGGVLVGLVWAFQRSLVFVPDASPAGSAADALPGARDLVLRTEDGLDLDAWLVPADAASDREVAILYAPGNGGNRAGRADVARLLAAEGFTVLLLDYRGYGGNPGSPTEDGLALDARAAAEALERAGFEPARTLYVGESLGTGVVARLQTIQPPAGVLLRSPFTDFAAVGAHHYPFLPVRALLRDRFPVVEHLRDSEVPVTVVHGTQDSVVPSSLSVEVARSAGNLVEELALPGVDHNDAEMFGAPVVEAVVRLADRVIGPRDR